jgi:hypothetical protein
MAKKKTRKRAVQPRRTILGHFLKLLLVCGLAIAFVAGLGWLGQNAANRIADKTRYAVPVTSIRFDRPPHTSTPIFLTEVRYLAGLPETVQSIDPVLPTRLSAAFCRHPWVESVTNTTIAPDGGIQVNLKYREPVLTIFWRNGTELEQRAVDATGVLLPADAPIHSLPVLTTERTIPKPNAGQTWPEPDVKQAAELIRRHLVKSIERTKTGWSITEPDGKMYTILSQTNR